MTQVAIEHAPAAPPLVSAQGSLVRDERDAHAQRSKRARIVNKATVVAPAAVAVAGVALALRGARGLGLGLVSASVGFAIVRWQLARFFTEGAPYEVEQSFGDIEVRRYAPQLRAETTIEETGWSEALEQGFRRLAGYIFGDNQGPKESERIEMTAPVLASVRDGSRTVAFVMPAERDADDLPWPNDDRVNLRRVPAHRVAVLSFSGDYKGELPKAKAEELLARVAELGLVVRGEPMFAGYDSPATLSILRRNEVSVLIADE